MKYPVLVSVFVIIVAAAITENTFKEVKHEKTKTATANTSSVESSEKSDLKKLPREINIVDIIAEEKADLYDRNTDWYSRESRLKFTVSQFTPLQLKSLAQITLSKTADNDERNISVYLLSLAGINARQALNMIASAVIAMPNIKDPHALVAAKLQETSLRLNALESLDVLSVHNPQEIHQDLQQILLLQQEPSLKTFANISLVGIVQGRPGKLSRWLNQIKPTSAESL